VPGVSPASGYSPHRTVKEQTALRPHNTESTRTKKRPVLCFLHVLLSACHARGVVAVVFFLVVILRLVGTTRYEQARSRDRSIQVFCFLKSTSLDLSHSLRSGFLMYGTLCSYSLASARWAFSPVKPGNDRIVMSFCLAPTGHRPTHRTSSHRPGRHRQGNTPVRAEPVPVSYTWAPAHRPAAGRQAVLRDIDLIRIAGDVHPHPRAPVRVALDDMAVVDVDVGR
jgi:hypothetical protein